MMCTLEELQQTLYIISQLAAELKALTVQDIVALHLCCLCMHAAKCCVLHKGGHLAGVRTRHAEQAEKDGTCCTMVPAYTLQ